MNAKEIGKHIREYRKANNVSQRELAEQLFVSDKTISRWELGNGLPDIELLPKIAEILGITIDKLVGTENLTGEDEATALRLYKKELEAREAIITEREVRAIEKAEEKKSKIYRIALIVAAMMVVLVLSVVLAVSLYKPAFTLNIVGANSEKFFTKTLHVGDPMPDFTIDGKTVIGFIDEEYRFYNPGDFVMPERNITLRPLIKEEMPIFTASDGNHDGEKIAEHVYTTDGTPATKYVFEAGSKKGDFLQSRPVSDSKEMEGINVYLPSLGERFFLLSINNTGTEDVKIRYRVENFGSNAGGLDYYTEPVTLKAGSVTYLPVYFECSGGYGVFEGCDHFIILDEDVSSRTELVVYGYIYISEELSDIRVTKNPDKFYYTEGETIDLGGMVVEAVLNNGTTTGKVALYDYTCDLEGKVWHKGMDTATVSFAGKSTTVTIHNPFSYSIAFTPAANIVSINNSGGADYIFAEYTTDSFGLPATRFTIKSGAKANMEVEAWINQVVHQTMADGVNLRIPTFGGEKRYLSLTVTNIGGDDISFEYYAENNGNCGGVTITVEAGQTKTVDFDVTPGGSIGCNYAIKLLSDVSEDTELLINGFFHCRDELSGIEEYSSTNKTTFKVGESFSSMGLVVKALGENYDEVVISNYKTDLDGYCFTEEDVGVKQVRVNFADFSFVYNIEIVA